MTNETSLLDLRYPTDPETFYAEYPSYLLAQPTVVFPVFATYAALCVLFKFAFTQRKGVAIPRWILVTHNLIQVVLSATMLFGLFYSVRCAGYSFYGNTIFAPRAGNEACEHMVTGFIRLFTLSKYYDLVDTLLIVLMNKQRQLSFLHCSHHALVPIGVWYGMWRSPNGDSFVPCMANSFIHLVMYSYFLLSSLRIRCPWKAHLTKLQLLQFAFLFAYGINCYRLNSIAVETTIINTGVQAAMLIMFGNFYAQSYLKPKRKSA